MAVGFELMGRQFFGLNGGSNHRIEGAGVSFMVDCESQEEVDRYGLAWQIVPRRLRELLADPDRARARAQRARPRPPRSGRSTARSP